MEISQSYKGFLLANYLSLFNKKTYVLDPTKKKQRQINIVSETTLFHDHQNSTSGQPLIDRMDQKQRSAIEGSKLRII